jgi:putative lysine transport system ATP-binding protein
MALMMIEFHSNVLELNTNLYVIKPNILQDNEELKVLYLLHGYQGNYANWVKYTNLLRYVDGTNLLVVMPSGYNSFYVNHEIFGDYSKYVAEEIYELINKTFNIKQTRENTFVAGLSMGGYGALKTALSYPEKYSKAVGFSSVIKLENMIDRVKDSLRPKTELFLNKDTAKKNSLYTLSKKALNKVELYFTCGTEDFLFNENEDFHKHLNEIKYNHTYLTGPGAHSWDYWDQEIKKALKWILK